MCIFSESISRSWSTRLHVRKYFDVITIKFIAFTVHSVSTLPCLDYHHNNPKLNLQEKIS